jgi:hypothetical protein
MGKDWGDHMQLPPLLTFVLVQDSFSCHDSKGSKAHMMSQHTNQESACSQDTMPTPLSSPSQGTQDCGVAC